MIITVDELLTYPAFSGQDPDILEKKLEGVENLIRKYTNNNFQNRNIRFYASSEGMILDNVSPYLKVGDTVQISQSGVNDGLYVITAINMDQMKTTLNKSMFTMDWNLVTKVEYPFDVVMGVINLMQWEISNREKVGIKQETLSRHSVTYFDQDKDNTVMGYPVSLLGFLDLYKKARFTT